MARSSILERREVDGQTYEVSRSGSTITLTTDGILHTAYDPRCPISGRVWDLLALPGIVIRARRVLVLGVGGGAVIQQLLRFGAPLQVDAVDLDATHLDLARTYFGLNDPRVTLHHADARDFIARSRAQYDYVLDDVFGELNGEPERAIPFDADWAARVTARVAKGGVLVVNNAGEHEATRGQLGNAEFLGSFASSVSMTTSTASNVVFALFRDATSPRGLRARAIEALGEDAAGLDLRIRTRGSR